MPPPSPLPEVLEQAVRAGVAGVVRLQPAAHGYGAMRHAEQPPRAGRDRPAGNELLHEDDPAAPALGPAPPHVEPQVHLLEPLAERQRYAEDARPEKHEADQADERTPLEEVQLEPRGKERPQGRRV